MREIKFRAWDKKYKRMIDGWDLEYLNEIFESKKDGHFVIDDDLEIMQYTQLKDKNGKEIFEGDIIKTRKDTTIVINSIFHGINFYEKEAEVIGNVYENPELLGGKRTLS